MKEKSAPQQDSEALNVLGIQGLEKGDWQAAKTCFEEALLLDANNLIACTNLALVREREARYEEAERLYQKALENQTQGICASNYANLLTRLKRLDEAEIMHRRALEAMPDSPVIWSNYGVTLACLQRFEEAETVQRRAIALSPDHASAHFNLSYLLLRKGLYKEGWQHFEYRKWYAALAAKMPCPRWQGESLEGKKLLIGFEAGHGDMIQFCRYVPVLKAQGAESIDLICHPGLVGLFSSLEGIGQLIPFTDNLPEKSWDYWTPPMSMPHYCQTRVETIPAILPYLHADPARVSAWRAKLPSGKPLVGLVWKGNPQYENDAERSLSSLRVLQSLSEIEGIQYVSLQKGEGENDVAALRDNWPLLDLGPELKDFADTAALIQNLDLVIGVDTAVAHLCGALGKTCWVLLPDYKTDWRWMTDRDDSPWYPQALRLFRQTAKRDWQETIARVKMALAQELGKPSRPGVLSPPYSSQV